MANALTTIIYISVAIGLIFNALGSISLFRFPDAYTRLHGATKCTTFGSIFSIMAVVFYAIMRGIDSGESRFLVLGLHSVIALAALLLTNPTSSHALARAAHKSGIKPMYAVVDKLEEDNAKDKEVAKGE